MEIAERIHAFRSAVAAFIEELRAAKENDKSYDPAKYEYRTWLADAARRASQIRAVTHVLKATHPDARGTSPRVPPRALPQRAEIGSHVLGDNFIDDVVGNAAALDVYKLLRLEVDGRCLLDWMQAGDSDLKVALSDDAGTATTWVSAFASLVSPDPAPASHAMAKQVYWLVGDDPLDDSQFHLLQPMFASSLAHAVHADIDAARFGEANKDARQAFRRREPSATPYHQYRDVVARKLGGTKPQNISQLNSERRGINYLLPSLPPRAWKPRETRLLNRDSVFDQLLWSGGMREEVRALIDFLKSNPPPTAETRGRREANECGVAAEMAMFGVAVRGRYDAGWTRHPECRLPRCEQLWLDPGRTQEAVRDDQQHPEWKAEDEAFNLEYQQGTWADQVAERFGNWLNAQLHREGLVEVSLSERDHWARQAILDVAWPIPMQRRAVGGSE